jgi:hypothetical protein
VIGEPVPVTVFATPPLLDVQVAVYCGAVRALPFVAPPTNVTVSDPVAVVVDPDAAETDVGAAGEPSMTGREAAEARLVPALLVDLTRHV